MLSLSYMGSVGQYDNISGALQTSLSFLNVRPSQSEWFIEVIAQSAIHLFDWIIFLLPIIRAPKKITEREFIQNRPCNG